MFWSFRLVSQLTLFRFTFLAIKMDFTTRLLAFANNVVKMFSIFINFPCIRDPVWSWKWKCKWHLRCQLYGRLEVKKIKSFIASTVNEFKVSDRRAFFPHITHIQHMSESHKIQTTMKLYDRANKRQAPFLIDYLFLLNVLCGSVSVCPHSRDVRAVFWILFFFFFLFESQSWAWVVFSRRLCLFVFLLKVSFFSFHLRHTTND